MIRVENLTKTFETDTTDFIAVDNLSFQVNPGEVYGLLGPNGAGKTTTMRMVLGLMQPTEGFAEVEGFRSSDSPDEVKRRIGFVSATAGIYQWLTVREMLGFFCEMYGLRGSEVEPRVDHVADLLDCRPFLDQRCANLSTGQRQRVNLARAIVHDPPTMLLDEPTLGLDVVASQVVFDYIRLAQELQKSIILCTHRLEQAERVCNRFGLLHQGKLVHEGSLQDLQNQTGQQNLVDMFLQMIKPTPAT
ncbi:MAG: ATP-binding cassette domain-containing protein [Planctomycetaceae bacterium]|nr:ATP-binding cassette domain-containing protein [Planctomycetaceae bacterium]MCP4461417.1 ATP-binding cassette domain-containing protein [Planctomycetaceae bacterium]MDG1808728.1 ATP-binding cassette domain-containing protein [Pirellulaceae bacterium]MDG2104881.1 ATP-binding cassette domain-containing protein [Pirellulaceae bacterium]